MAITNACRSGHCKGTILASQPRHINIGVKHLNWLWSGAAPIAHGGRCEKIGVYIVGNNRRPPPGI